MNNTVEDFIIGQTSNAKSKQAAALASAISESIKEFKESGGESESAFSVDAQYENGKFTAQCDFTENCDMTIMYCEGSDNETVASLFNLQNHEELCRLAGLMLSESWVDGYNGQQ